MGRNPLIGWVCLALFLVSSAPSTANAASCCQTSPLPMCDDAMVMLCVCMIDMNCCTFGWDAVCVAEVTAFGCGTCGCQPNCGGKQCGNDGCGGSCGQCMGNNVCQNGACIAGCTPNCAGKQCGPDGCGGVCGSCQPNFNCVVDQCQPDCVPQCAGVQCGPDGCGGSCGSCGFGEICANGTCQLACEPQCVGKQCGSDSCGDLCGTCAPGEACNADGQCNPLCEKQCLNKECGPDGCGGLCGNCGFDATCSSDGMCISGEGPGDPDVNSQTGNDAYVPGPDDYGSKDGVENPGGPDAGGGPGGPASCPYGHTLVYGKCVPNSQLADEDDGGSADSGCAAGGRPVPAGLPLLPLLGLLLMLCLIYLGKSVRPGGGGTGSPSGFELTSAARAAGSPSAFPKKKLPPSS